MADRTLRAIITGSSAGAVKAFEEAAGASETSGSRMSKATQSTQSKIGSAFMRIGAGVAVAAVALSAYSVKQAQDLQSASAQIAAHEDISVGAANRIGNAFLTTAGQSIYSGAQMAQAFAPVSGVFEQLNGRALSASQSLSVMRNASNLAEASGETLSTTVSSLASVMQSFQIPVAGATTAANQLWSTSRVTGIGLDTLTSTVQKLHSRLGAATPSLGDLSTLMVDLAQHGVTGSRGLMVVNTAVTTLMNSVQNVSQANALATQKYTDSVVKAQGQVSMAQDAVKRARDAALTSSNQLAAQASIAQANQQLADAQQNLNLIQQQGIGVTNAAGVQLAQLGVQVYNSKGTFVGLGSVISQLYPKLQGLTEQQRMTALSAIFGSSAAKALYNTVEAGPAPFAKAAEAVNRSGAAQQAAAAQSKTLKHELETAKATASDLAAKFGEALLPKLQMVLGVITGLVGWLEKHKAVAIVLAGVVGGILLGAVAAWTVGTLSSAAAALAAIAPTTAFGAAAASAAIALDSAILPIAAIVAGVALLAVGVFELVKHWGAVEALAKKVWHGVQRVFDDFMGFVKHWGVIVLEAVLAPFTGGLSLLVPMLVKHWRAVSSFFSSIPHRVISALGDLGSVLLSAGEKLLDGLLHGMEKGVGKIGSVVKDIGKHILHSVTSFFGIFSPSTVFAGYGQNLMEGLASGITTHATKASAAMGAAARAVSANASFGSAATPAGGLSAGPGGPGGQMIPAVTALTAAVRALTSADIRLGHTIEVNTKSNASARDIASEVGWQLRVA